MNFHSPKSKTVLICPVYKFSLGLCRNTATGLQLFATQERFLNFRELCETSTMDITSAIKTSLTNYFTNLTVYNMNNCTQHLTVVSIAIARCRTLSGSALFQNQTSTLNLDLEVTLEWVIFLSHRRQGRFERSQAERFIILALSSSRSHQKHRLATSG